MLDSVTIETFQPHLNEVFKLSVDDDTSIDLDLVEVEAMREQKRPSFGQQVVDPPSRKPFTLVFRGPLTTRLVQRMYRMSHPTLGDFEHMFLVPIAEDSAGLYYEAVFT